MYSLQREVINPFKISTLIDVIDGAIYVLIVERIS